MSENLEALKNWGCDVDSALERMLDDEEFLMDCVTQVAADPSFDTLGETLKEKNTEAAFDAAHTLKGIYANTGLTPLYDIVVKIVEPLRKGENQNLMPLYDELGKKKEELLVLLDSLQK